MAARGRSATVGNAVGILFSAALFITTVQVEPTLLMAMVISAGAGAWIGAGADCCL